MKKGIIGLSLMICMLMGAACQPESIDANAIKSERTAAADLIGSWTFKHFGDNTEYPYEVSLEFKGEADESGGLRLSGRSSVNHYFAAYQADAAQKKLSLANLGSTRMAGSPDAMQFEQRYFDLLKNAASYQLKDSGQTLVITTSGDSAQSMYFERSK